MTYKQDPIKETDDRLNIRPADDVRRAILVVLAERPGKKLTTTDVFKLVCDKLGYFVSRDVVYNYVLPMQMAGEIEGERDGENGRWRWIGGKEREG